VNSLGDTLTPEQLSVADDLYYQKIPELWREVSGVAAPPSLQSLSTFMNDITARSTHFERILVLVRFIIVTKAINGSHVYNDQKSKWNKF
jgi:hypothetical protein